MNAQLPITQPKAALVAGNRPMAIVPQSIEEVWRLSELMAKSGLAPKDMNTQEKCAVAILHGLEVGLSPMQAVQKIAIINGRPTIWGDAALGLVKASGVLEHIYEDGDNESATCTVKRAGEPDFIKRTFTADDAKKAGLWGKPGPWQQYTKRMLQMRARAFALRDVFPDVLGGMYIREELDNGDNARDVTPIEPPTPPEPPEPPATDAAERMTEEELVKGLAPLLPPEEKPDTLGGKPDVDAIPPGLRRAKKSTAPEKREDRKFSDTVPARDGHPGVTADLKELRFCPDQWYRDLEGAISGCTTVEQLIEVKKKVQKPAKGKVGDEHYGKGERLVEAALMQLADEE